MKGTEIQPGPEFFDCSKHPMTPFWKLILSAVGADVIRLALEEDWFSKIEKTVKAAELANALNRDYVLVKAVLMHLSGCGLVLCDFRDESINTSDSFSDAYYSLTNIAKQYFLKSSSDFCGDAWLFRLKSIRDFSESLSFSRPHPDVDRCSEQARKNWASAAESHLAQEQKVLTAKAAVQIVKKISGTQAVNRYLDLGGGPGFVAIDLAKLLPHTHGVIYDFPETAQAATQNIQENGLAHRLQAIGGNINEGNFDGTYDMIWCSSVLHFVQNLEKSLDAIKNSLNPGGILISVHAEIPIDMTKDHSVMSYYLPLLLRGCYVGVEGDLAYRFQKKGFRVCASYPLDSFPMAPLTVIIARKTQDE